MAHEVEFNTFWKSYPRREGKLAARKAYDKARKIATADAILAGVLSYVDRMPEEMRFRPLPASWLNAGRWMDDVPPASWRTRDEIDWYQQCKEVHGGECGLDRWRHMTRMQKAKA